MDIEDNYLINNLSDNYIMKENGFTMFLHSAIITVILYLLMVIILRQRMDVALDRSILIGAITLVYMIVFGHGLPYKINPNLI